MVHPYNEKKMVKIIQVQNGIVEFKPNCWNRQDIYIDKNYNYNQQI